MTAQLLDNLAIRSLEAGSVVHIGVHSIVRSFSASEAVDREFLWVVESAEIEVSRSGSRSVNEERIHGWMERVRSWECR